MEIKATVNIYKGPKIISGYQRKIWTIKYMRPSDIAQSFVDELDWLVQRIKSKKET